MFIQYFLWFVHVHAHSHFSLFSVLSDPVHLIYNLGHLEQSRFLFLYESGVELQGLRYALTGVIVVADFVLVFYLQTRVDLDTILSKYVVETRSNGVAQVLDCAAVALLRKHIGVHGPLTPGKNVFWAEG